MEQKQRFALVILFGAFLSMGPVCGDGATAQEACDHACECWYFFPSDQQACVPDCTNDLFGVPPECLSCIAETECKEITDGNFCQLECPWMWIGEHDDG